MPAFLAAVPLIIQAIEALISFAPKGVEVVSDAKNWVAGLFNKGLITKELQDALMLHIDARAALVAAGVTPISWTVEADPTA